MIISHIWDDFAFLPQVIPWMSSTIDIIEINPDYESDFRIDHTYNVSSCAFFDLEDFKKAIADFTKELEISPADEYAYYNRGRAYHDLKEYEKAKTDFTKAIEIDPSFEDGYFDRGCAYFELKEFKNLNTTTEINPSFEKMCLKLFEIF